MESTRSSPRVDERRARSPVRTDRRRLLADALFPVGAQGTAVLIGVVFVLGFVTALFRLGPDLGGPRLWAEDGLVFVYQGATGDSFLTVVTQTYAGYLHLAPRLVVELLRLLPFTEVAAGVVVACALVQALVAAVTVHVLVGLGARWWLAVVPAAAVCAVPVGPEVVLNVANLQWFLLYLSMVVLLWRPSTRRGGVLQFAAVLLTTLSSPFGLFLVALATLRAGVLRTRAAVALLVVGAAGTVVQLTVMVSGRSVRPEPTPVRASTLVAAYLRRVVADGVLGLGRLEDSRHSPEIAMGVVILAAFLILAALAARRRGAPVVIQLAVLVGMSLGAYLVPMVIASGTGIDAIFQGRYALAPAFLWLCALCLAGSAAVSADIWGWLAGVFVAGLTAAVVFGMVTTYATQVPLRERNATWATQATTNELACAMLDSAADREFAMPPATPFDFALSCQQIEGW